MTMRSRSIARELALLTLSQLDEKGSGNEPLEQLLLAAMTTIESHVREALDQSAQDLHNAEQRVLDSEISTCKLEVARDHLRLGLEEAEQALNRLSAALNLPRMLLLADQHHVRSHALELAAAVQQKRHELDAQLDAVMTGWRMARLPRLDRDILRLAAAEITGFDTPVRVVCNEAVTLATSYSDEEGKRRINGVLRRFTAAESARRSLQAVKP